MKARIEEFNALAGYEHVHKGMTSRDLTENVEQLQIVSSLKIIRDRLVASLTQLARLAMAYADQPIAGRSHNVAAQITTLGKRFATAADEQLIAYRRIDELIARYPLRGIKGPVGTGQDMLDLLGGDGAKLAELERLVAAHLGVATILTSTGQVYPRSLDFDVVTALAQAAAAPSNVATSIRLMAGHELVTEGFRPGQVGSSAMPHKMNTRSCERVNGLAVIVRGYVSMVGELAGDQWNEGDVSCSVVRRVALPDAFYALDGLFETFLTVLGDFGAFPAVIDNELQRYLPFLTTTKVLMAAVRKGVGRETAHEAIKEHAVSVALAMRERGLARNDLFDRLAADARLGPEPGRARRPGHRAADHGRHRAGPGRLARRPGGEDRRPAPRGGDLPCPATCCERAVVTESTRRTGPAVRRPGGGGHRSRPRHRPGGRRAAGRGGSATGPRRSRRSRRHGHGGEPGTGRGGGDALRRPPQAVGGRLHRPRRAALRSARRAGQRRRRIHRDAGLRGHDRRGLERDAGSEPDRGDALHPRGAAAPASPADARRSCRSAR